MKYDVIIVMGVAGCGKSTFGEALAAELGTVFLEGDQFHPKENIAKMSAGVALTDEDRMPWLDRLADQAAQRAGGTRSVVVGCSALKKSYRDRLRKGIGKHTGFVYLKGSRELIAERMRARAGHFMPLSLLESQFATLEDPSGEEDVHVVDISLPADTELKRIAKWLKP